MEEKQSQTSSWRNRYPVHPSAAVFPMLGAEELQALADDIKAHGLKEPIVLWRGLDGQQFLIDGRNRLEAAERGGVEIPESMFRVDEGNPAALAISLNIKRRHLPKKEQARLIHSAISAWPAVSGQPDPKPKGGRPKNPVKAAAVAEAKKHGISESTVKRGLAEDRREQESSASAVNRPQVHKARGRTRRTRRRAVPKAALATAEPLSATVDVSAPTPEATVIVSAATAEKELHGAIELWVDAQPTAARAEACERLIAFVQKLKVETANVQAEE